MYDQAPRPSPGPHKLRESLPLTIFLRNRLKYALTGREVTSIVKQRLIKIDGKVRTDTTYPAGFMGVFKTIYLHDGKKLIFEKFPQMSSPSKNLESTSDSSTMSKVVSPSTVSQLKKPPTSS